MTLQDTGHRRGTNRAGQLGLAFGSRIGERWREAAERIAGAALAALGIFLIIDKLPH